MNYRKLKILILFVSLYGSLTIKAQEQISTAGSNIQAGSAEVSYTIGQIFTSIDSNGTISEGVQQPYEISVVSKIKNPKTEISVETFPNPTSDKLNLKVNVAIYENLVYSLYDIKGVKIQAGNIIQKETIVDMSKLKKGTYLITIQLSYKETETYKIIKT